MSDFAWGLVPLDAHVVLVAPATRSWQAALCAGPPSHGGVPDRHAAWHASAAGRLQVKADLAFRQAADADEQ